MTSFAVFVVPGDAAPRRPLEVDLGLACYPARRVDDVAGRVPRLLNR